MKEPRKTTAIRKAWHPPEWDDEDARAIQSLELYAQSADDPKYKHLVPAPEDVRRALNWIIYKAAGTYEEPFLPGQPDVGHYLMGRASVGRAIVKMMKLKIGKLKDE